MKKSPDRKHVKRYTVTLSDCEVRRLTRYAKASNIDRPTALHRLLSQSLREATADLSEAPAHNENQLGLFDTLQIDIFNNTHKVE